MRAKSFSAEKRMKQDQQAFVALAILLGIIVLGAVWESAAPYCWASLQGAWGALFIIMLRYGYRVVSGKRFDAWGILDALAFLVIWGGVTARLYPRDLWHAGIMLLCFVSTVFGIQHFRFTPLFMLINCLVAGAILL